MRGLVQARGAFGEAFDLIFRKNEAMIGGLPGNSFVLVEFEESGGVLEVAALALDPVSLDFAEVVHGLLELAREPLVVQTEGGEGAVGVDDVEIDCGLIGGRVGGAVEEGGFERGDAGEGPHFRRSKRQYETRIQHEARASYRNIAQTRSGAQGCWNHSVGGVWVRRER
jgi:hypothetical protein